MSISTFRLPVLLLSLVALNGCAVVALPFRVAADVVDIVPVVGPVVAAPFEAAAEVID